MTPKEQYMKEIGNRIRSMRLSREWTQTDLSKASGIPQSTIAGWESGIRTPSRENLEVLADVFDSAPLLIQYGEDALMKKPGNLVALEDLPRHKIPLIGSVAAGVPILAEEEYEVQVDGPVKASYALKVEGDSMQPIYEDGDIVYIREQPNVDDGQIAVVLVDDSATLKRVYHLPNGLQLISENPKYAPMIMTFEDYDVIMILGVPVGYTRIYQTQTVIKKGL